MDASLRWINALLDRPVECEEAADLLTRAGFPVEHTEAVATRMGEDIRLDVETTSNRGDCNAHLGLAREVVALTDRQLKDPTQLAPADPVDSSEAGVSVENKAPEDCLVYHARIVRGVKVGPSPDWLAAHLEARGDVPRNNIVDATNYVLHELGHPVHAFDLDKLEGGEINIRYAQTGETMLPLGADAKEIELSAEDLVIADAAKPIALAGVKGGAASSVDENTTDLLLETATFTPSAVRRSSRRHGIASDSSYRFERQVPDRQVPIASERLLQLILSVAGGEAAPPTMVGTIAPAPTMTLRFSRIKTVLGIEIPSERVIEILDALGLQPQLDGDTVSCTAPIGRADLTREIDLIEEVARIHGLESLPVEDAANIRIRPAQSTEMARRLVRDMLVGFGAYETVSHTLVSEAAATRFLEEGQRGLRVDDERAGGTPILRPSLIDTLTTIAGRNHDASGRKAALFEVAAVFHETDQGHEERTATALLMPCEERSFLATHPRLHRSNGQHAHRRNPGCHGRRSGVVSPGSGSSLARSAYWPCWTLGARDCGRPRAGRTMGRLRSVPGTSAGPLATGNFGRPAPGLPRHRTRFVVGRLGRCSVARHLVVDRRPATGRFGFRGIRGRLPRQTNVRRTKEFDPAASIPR